jgi:anti-sigma regulatory factor (Ser/Thr protein kinase)
MVDGDRAHAPIVLGEFEVQGRREYLSALRTAVRQLVLARSPSVADDVGLMAGELIANGVQYTHSARPGGSITVLVHDETATLKISVIDCGGTDSKPQIVDLTDEEEALLNTRGRGLRIVDELSLEWGADLDPATGQNTVWFRVGTGLARPPRP